MSNFITNSQQKQLKTRLIELLAKSDELKFLIGFFYFSGIRELYNGLKENPKVTIKVLVGLDVDKINYRLIEHSEDEKLSDEEKIENFFSSVKKSINNDAFDVKEFYEQSTFFLKLIADNRLIIRKTYRPNHSKLYLFKLEEGQVGKSKLFITGSSNLTRAGLSEQNEFNVEISDYGFEEAEKYFDDLWNTAVKITEQEDIKERLIKTIENETHIRKIKPFEAYVFVLKSYLDSFQHKSLSSSLKELLSKKGYKNYKYQNDAVEIALSIIEQHGGVLVADVVGLGKSVIACMIAKQLRARGLVLCPPGLIGDDNKTEGWRKYLNEFQLYDWEARSIGDLEEVLDFVKNNDDIEVIIVDEAHRFRNPDTQSYELLKNICRNKKVILLTATPFNNKPEDILAMLNLFIIPKQSSITLENNIISTFRTINTLFDRLAYITKNYNSKDKRKLNRAKSYYRLLFDESEIDLRRVKRKSHSLAKQIRDVIEPITIRRNRLDLLKNPFYKNEVKDLSKVEPPIEWFYELTDEQSSFYDEIMTNYFEDPDYGGKFKGAIYLPFVYEEGVDTRSSDDKDKEKNRELLQQRNLFDIMRRLLVKRFESSFGAFVQSIKNFKHIN
ncbi:SNF2-related protein [Melioribacter sp. OK-6-Me]|uniref:SNF2-related protein n=1 Tax=unclassified Melioribacter TaxID=2627329 RepID=UPI003EDA0B10